MLYAVTVNYERPGLADDAYTVSGSLPTVFLDSNVQGIVSEAHAESIVRSSLVTLLPTGTFHVCATAV